jgi:hypothetical protein
MYDYSEEALNLLALTRLSALLIQVAGAASTGASRQADRQVLNGELYFKCWKLELKMLLGIHIYMGGVAVQQFFILVFFFYAIKFHQTIHNHIRQGVEGVFSVLPLLHALYAVLLLITVR